MIAESSCQHLKFVVVSINLLKHVAVKRFFILMTLYFFLWFFCWVECWRYLVNLLLNGLQSIFELSFVEKSEFLQLFRFESFFLVKLIDFCLRIIGLMNNFINLVILRAVIDELLDLNGYGIEWSF